MKKSSDWSNDKSTSRIISGEVRRKFDPFEITMECGLGPMPPTTANLQPVAPRCVSPSKRRALPFSYGDLWD